MVWLEERAENLDFTTLNKLDSILFNFKKRLKEYLLSDEKRPIFILGPKGCGKTFQVMKSLSEVVQENEKFVPIMFTFKKGVTRQVLEPLKLATPEIWKERLEFYRDTKKLMDLSNAIIVDDIHYVCEAMVKGEYNPNDFLNFLTEIIHFVNLGKKAILISEDIPSFYTKNLKMKEFDELWPRFGIHPQPFYETREEWERFSQKIDYLAFREVPTYTFQEWRKLIQDYGIFLEEPFEEVLYRMSPKPRSFVRFTKLFQPETYISLDEIKQKSLELLTKKVKRDIYQFYEPLINKLTVIRSPGGVNFIQVLRTFKGMNNLRKLGSVIDYLEKVCSVAAKSLPFYKKDIEDLRLIIKRSYKNNPIHTQKILQQTIKSIVPEEKREVVNDVIKTYFMATKIRPKDICLANEMLDELEEGLSGNKKYLSKLIKDFPNYYIKRLYGEFTQEWLLYKPFEVAFGDIIYEMPTLKVIAQTT